MRLLVHPPLATRLATRVTRARLATDCARAEALLGPRHELVRNLRAMRTTVEQMVVASLGALCGALAPVAGRHAILVALAGTSVEAVLVCRLAVLRLRRRDVCGDLIIAGRGRLPLAVLEGETRRLQSRRCREQLARLLEAIPATSGRRYGCAVGALVSVRVVSAVAPLLREIAVVLRSDDCSLRGVALTERLVTRASLLYGTDAEGLRRELGRIRMVLSERSDQRSPADPP